MSIVNVALTVACPLCLSSNPLAADLEKTELGVSVFGLQGAFLTAEYMVPPVGNGDAASATLDKKWLSCERLVLYLSISVVQVPQRATLP